MALHPLVAEHLDDIRALSEKYGVKKLEIFGSAMTDEFDPERSDVDFIVHYPGGYKFGYFGSRLFEFEDELTDVLGRSAEVCMTSILTDPHFRDSADQTRKVIYDAYENAGGSDQYSNTLSTPQTISEPRISLRGIM